MPITNTLENAKKLESLGAPAPLARGIAEIVEEAIQASNQDLKVFFREEMERQFSAFRAEVKIEIASVRNELKAEIAAVRSELKAEIAAVRNELKAEIAAVRGEISDVRGEMKTEMAAMRGEMQTGTAQTRADLQREMRQQMLWFFTMAAGIATISVAIIKLFPNAG